MIDIPLGKALVPVKDGKCCDCYFNDDNTNKCQCNRQLSCEPTDRKDGKNVIFKLVDYKGKGEEK
jgi:hypothetical protein